MVFEFIFGGLVTGFIVAYFIFLYKRYKVKKLAIKRIQKQDITFIHDGKKVDFKKEVEKLEKKKS